MREMYALLHYEPASGELWWKIPSGNAKPGEDAGARDRNGYRMVRVLGQRYKVSRLCWFLYYGKWPDGEIDHINGVRDDDRILNLREATRSQNQSNVAYKNRSGFRGVTKTREGRWIAFITAGGSRNRNLGTFDTPEEAHAAYLNAAKERFGEFAFAR